MTIKDINSIQWYVGKEKNLNSGNELLDGYTAATDRRNITHVDTTVLPTLKRRQTESLKLSGYVE